MANADFRVQRWRVRLGRIAAAAVVLAAGGGLAACQQPSPLATVSAGATFATVDAMAYCATAEPGGQIDGCRTTGAKPRAIRVPAGTAVGVQIPVEVRQLPWVVRVIGVTASGKTKPTAKAQDSQPLFGRSYISLTPSFTDTNSLLVEILSLNAVASRAVPVARWQIVLHRG